MPIITRKQKIILMILGIAVVIVLALIIFLEMKNRQIGKIVPPDTSSSIDGNVYVPDDEAATRPHDWEETELRQPVPVDIKVPEVGENIPTELVDVVAVPEQSIDTGTEGNNFRIFRVRAENDKFLPSQVIANFRDMVHIELMAIDKDYDLVLSGYNMMIKAKQGETKAVEFQAVQDGRFIYYCESCGGVNSTARGEIIIVK